MFGAYRIGANTPSHIQIPSRISSSVNEARGRWEGVYDLASDTPKVVEGSMKVSNFFTGQENGNPISYYKQGAAIGGPWIATPAFMLDEMKRLVGEANSIGKDIVAARDRACAIPTGLDLSNRGDNPCGRLNTFIENAWSPFLFELKEFVLSHKAWHERLWGALYTEIQEYRKRVIALREKAISLGVETTAPAPTLPPKPAIEELGAFIKTVLYFLVGGTLIWLVFKIVSPLYRGTAVAA